MKNNNKEYHKPIPTTVVLSPCIIEAAKAQSIKMGCRLKNTGSLNYFVTQAVLNEFDRRGLKFRKLYPEFYK
jgi:hypothetical protein